MHNRFDRCDIYSRQERVNWASHYSKDNWFVLEWDIESLDNSKIWKISIFSFLYFPFSFFHFTPKELFKNNKCTFSLNVFDNVYFRKLNNFKFYKNLRICCFHVTFAMYLITISNIKGTTGKNLDFVWTEYARYLEGCSECTTDY